MFTQLVITALLSIASFQAYGSGSSGGSGGSQGAAGGSSPKLEAGVMNKLQQEQEKKLLELQKAASQKVDASFDQEHHLFNELLKNSVKTIRNGQATQVDYKNIDHAKLKLYLNSLSSVTRTQFNLMTRDQKLAFLINTYNAFTIDLIAKDPSIKSIKDLGSFLSSPWKKKFISLFSETLSLDEIEHGLIRKDPQFQEPRIHFAVNCASIGCPALLPEAFVASRLSQQLDTATKNFLNDRERNRVDGNTVTISKIFDWYAEDFEKSWQGITSVQDFLAKYSSSLADNPEQEKLLKEKNYKLKYSDYNWSLNKTNN